MRADRKSRSENPVGLSISGILLHLGIYAALWMILTRGDTASWTVGLPAIALALWTTERLAPARIPRIHLPSLLLFIPALLQLSVNGGLDVARRAMARDVRLDPDLLEYPLRLPAGTARVLFMNLISLLPGTLSANLRGDLLTVHVLDRGQDTRSALARLEENVARIFSMRLNHGEQGA